MTILLHKHYLVKRTTEGEGDQTYPKIWPRGLWMTPCEIELNPDLIKLFEKTLSKRTELDFWYLGNWFFTFP